MDVDVYRNAQTIEMLRNCGLIFSYVQKNCRNSEAAHFPAGCTRRSNRHIAPCHQLVHVFNVGFDANIALRSARYLVK